MTKCNYCGFEAEEPKGWKKAFCDTCVPDKEIGVSKVLQTVHVDGYGTVLQSRINEMARRVIIDNKQTKTGYFCGRLGENGKIAEHPPSYGG